jgi:two-component system, LytTR family, sensor kinase
MSKAIMNKVLIIVLHVCGWALLFMLPFRFMLADPHFVVNGVALAIKADSVGFPPPPHRYDTAGVFNERIRMRTGPRIRSMAVSTGAFDTSLIRIETVLTNSLLAIFFYTNVFILIPKILSRKGWGPYVLLIALVLLAYWWRDIFSETFIFSERQIGL